MEQLHFFFLPGLRFDFDLVGFDEVADFIGGLVLLGAVAEADLHLVRLAAVLELDLVAVEVNGLDGERVGEELLGRLPGLGLFRCRKRRGGLLGGGGLDRFGGGGCAFGHTITSLCWRGFFRIGVSAPNLRKPTVAYWVQCYPPSSTYGLCGRYFGSPED